MEFEYTHRVAA